MVRSPQPAFVPVARTAQLHTPLIPQRPTPIDTQQRAAPSPTAAPAAATRSVSGSSESGAAQRVLTTEDPLSMHTPLPIQTAASSDSMHDFRDPSGGGRSAAVAMSHGTPRKTTVKTLDALTSEFLAGSRCAQKRKKRGPDGLSHVCCSCFE
jgi:hypothetical protein